MSPSTVLNATERAANPVVCYTPAATTALTVMARAKSAPRVAEPLQDLPNSSGRDDGLTRSQALSVGNPVGGYLL
jgi:hypothetical protein